MDGYKLFPVAINSLATHDPHERKPVGFLKRANLTTTEELAKLGTERQVQVEKKIIALLSEVCERIEKSQVSAGTVNNWVKGVRLFLEMNDVNSDVWL
jgi:hypothetical protein